MRAGAEVADGIVPGRGAAEQQHVQRDDRADDRGGAEHRGENDGQPTGHAANSTSLVWSSRLSAAASSGRFASSAARVLPSESR